MQVTGDLEAKPYPGPLHSTMPQWPPKMAPRCLVLKMQGSQPLPKLTNLPHRLWLGLSRQTAPTYNRRTPKLPVGWPPITVLLGPNKLITLTLNVPLERNKGRQGQPEWSTTEPSGNRPVKRVCGHPAGVERALVQRPSDRTKSIRSGPPEFTAGVLQ